MAVSQVLMVLMEAPLAMAMSAIASTVVLVLNCYQGLSMLQQLVPVHENCSIITQLLFALRKPRVQMIHACNWWGKLVSEAAECS